MFWKKGIVLAAGASSRLPNKLMMPTHSNEPLITNAIHWLYMRGINDIVVVTTPDSIIGDYVKAREVLVTIAHQEKQLGVVDAIRCGWTWSTGYDYGVFVVCADNVFPHTEYLPEVNENTPPMAQVRNIAAPLNAELDGFQEGHWEYRAGIDRDGYAPSLAGWLYLRERPTLEDCAYANRNGFGLPYFLNRISAQPVEFPADGWWDLGTYNAYREYWRTFVCPPPTTRR